MKLSNNESTILKTIVEVLPKQSSVIKIARATGIAKHSVYSAMRTLHASKLANVTLSDQVYLMNAGLALVEE